MSIDTSNSFNNNGLLGTLKRSTLKRFSQNRFSLSSGNHNAVSLNTTSVYRQSVSNTESSRVIDGTQTLGRPRKLKNSLNHTSVSALEEAKKKFSNDGMSEAVTAFSENPEGNISFVNTLRRKMSMCLVNLLEKPEERLEKAKKSFLASEYEESKNLFKNLLGSRHLDTPEKKSEISLYLAAIYLLEKNGFKAESFLDGASFLKLIMGNHAKHLIKQHNERLANSEHKETPFPEASFYEISLENACEYEKIIINKLFASFGKKTLTQNIQ